MICKIFMVENLDSTDIHTYANSYMYIILIYIYKYVNVYFIIQHLTFFISLLKIICLPYKSTKGMKSKHEHACIFKELKTESFIALRELQIKQ